MSAIVEPLEVARDDGICTPEPSDGTTPHVVSGRDARRQVHLQLRQVRVRVARVAIADRDHRRYAGTNLGPPDDVGPQAWSAAALQRKRRAAGKDGAAVGIENLHLVSAGGSPVEREGAG